MSIENTYDPKSTRDATVVAPLLVRAIAVGWLDKTDTMDLVECIAKGEDFGVEELLIEIEGDNVKVRFLDEVVVCSKESLLALLRDLLNDTNSFATICD